MSHLKITSLFIEVSGSDEKYTLNFFSVSWHSFANATLDKKNKKFKYFIFILYNKSNCKVSCHHKNISKMFEVFSKKRSQQ